MSGILASSAAHTMTAPDTSPNDVESGYVTNQQIALSTTPTGTTYVWALSIPSGSTPARSGLTAASGATSSFTPDVAGEYVVQCIVDGVTVYVIRCSVANAAAQDAIGALRFMPLADSTVQTPSTGRVLYYSSTQSKMVTKDSSGTVHPLTET